MFFPSLFDQISSIFHVAADVLQCQSSTPPNEKLFISVVVAFFLGHFWIKPPAHTCQWFYSSTKSYTTAFCHHYLRLSSLRVFRVHSAINLRNEERNSFHEKMRESNLSSFSWTCLIVQIVFIVVYIALVRYGER